MDEILEEKNTLFSIADLITLPQRKESKFSFEFQQLCTELEPIYGKAIWSLPYKPGFTEYKIRKAFEIAKAKGVMSLGYLIGIVKRMP